MIVLIICLMTLSLSQLQESNDTPSEPSVPVRISYTIHAPIYIDGNAGFLESNASTGISCGNGTALNPYIIENWDINASAANGIEIRNSNVYFTIRYCYVHDGRLSFEGICLQNCRNGTLSNNNCSNNNYGIGLYATINNTLENNTCNSNNWHGIELWGSSDNTLSNNTCSSNIHYGMYLYSSSDNTMEKNMIGSNNDAGILIYTSSNNTLNNNCCSNDGYGIWLYGSVGITLINNNCSGNWNGIVLWYSVSNALINNNCFDNYDGMYFDESSNNSLIGNNCSNNQNGIFLASSSNNNNTLVWNQLCNNIGYGLIIYSGSFNTIWNNTFIGNSGSGSIYNLSHIQAYDGTTNNCWNSTNGYGNFWSDWTTPDASLPWGIVDNPYPIEGVTGAKDYYPQTTAPIIPEPSILLLIPMMLIAFLLISRRSRKKA